MKALQYIDNDFGGDHITDLAVIGSERQVARIFEEGGVMVLRNHLDGTKPIAPAQKIHSGPLTPTFRFQCLDDYGSIVPHGAVNKAARGIGDQPDM